MPNRGFHMYMHCGTQTHTLILVCPCLCAYSLYKHTRKTTKVTKGKKKMGESERELEAAWEADTRPAPKPFFLGVDAQGNHPWGL